MATIKQRRITKIVREFVKTQDSYDITGVDLALSKFFYRASQELFQDLSTGDYRVDTSAGKQTLVITNQEILSAAEAFQVGYVLDFTATKYETQWNVDINTLKDRYNQLVDNTQELWEYIRKTGFISDDTTIDLILPQLDINEVWVRGEDGYVGMPINDIQTSIKDAIQKYLLEVVYPTIDGYVEATSKPALDEYVETTIKPDIDDFTDAKEVELQDLKDILANQLQELVDNALADRGVIPNGTDWNTLSYGTWYVSDLNGSNYTNHPNLEDAEGVGVVLVTDSQGGNAKVIRYYSMQKKMHFKIKNATGVWSEWSTLSAGGGVRYEYTQANHGFLFTPVMLDGISGEWVRATTNGADGIAVYISRDRFELIMNGSVQIPNSAKDVNGDVFVNDEYYFLSNNVAGGLDREKPTGIFQPMIRTYLDEQGRMWAEVEVDTPVDLVPRVLNEEAETLGIQMEVDNRLQTESKAVVGAINELNDRVGIENTIADLVASNRYALGDVVEVLGFHAKGDGAHHKRKIESADDGSGVRLANGLWANTVDKMATVVFSFDDNKPEDDYVFKLFKSKGITCTFGVITENIDVPSSNILEKLYNYAKNGFDITSHSSRHTRVPTDLDFAKFEYENSRRKLNRLGFESRGLIVPYSTISTSVLEIAKNSYDYILVGGNGEHKKSEIPKDKKITRVHLNSLTLEEKKNLIKKAQQQNLLISFYAHQNDKGEDFDDFINWVVGQNIKIKNVEEGVLSFYPELRNSSFLEENTVEFEDLSLLQNSNVISSKLSYDSIYVQDHHNVGITRFDRSFRIPSCSSGSTFTIQSKFYIDKNKTYRIEPRIKFSNSRFNLFTTTLEIRLFNSSGSVVKNIINNFVSSNLSFNEDVFLFTNSVEATEMLVIARLVLNSDLDVFCDLEIDKIKVSNLSKHNNFITKKTEVDILKLRTEIDLNRSFGSGLAVATDRNSKIVLSMGVASGLPDVYSNQISYDRLTKKIAFRYYDNSQSNYSEWKILSVETNPLQSINTPYHTTKMQQEGVYEDFIQYMDSKTEYDRLQRELEQQRQLAFEQSGMENYEEWLAEQPMMLPAIEEPQPSEALLKFKEKYLG